MSKLQHPWFTWFVDKSLMAMFGLGVVIGIIEWVSGKFGMLPYAGLWILGIWAPLQCWYAFQRSIQTEPANQPGTDQPHDSESA